MHDIEWGFRKTLHEITTKTLSLSDGLLRNVSILYKGFKFFFPDVSRQHEGITNDIFTIFLFTI